MALKLTTRIFIVLIVAALTYACNNSGCLDNQSAIPLAGMYSSETGKAISVNIVEIHGVGAPNDSLIVRGGTSISRVYLPMRSTMSTTTWCLHYTQSNISDPAFNDTIEFDYKSIPYFASEECGAYYQYRIESLRYTTHLLDSVALTDSLMTNADIERIRIYFRTADPEPEQPQEPEESEEPNDSENQEDNNAKEGDSI
ncbi:MAG: hypothetical protein J1F05_01105 [Muribaculaceae bacterium]|nr:hypothetical protein [Muribaculaceae bacterium]